jgi:uncharacterized membrane protein YfcA
MSGEGRVDFVHAIEIGAVGAIAAVLGSMLGLGGGVFLVPILTLYFGVDPKLAVGASAVAVVTNSVVGSTNHLRSRFTNLRLAMLLQVAMATGAIAGALYGVAADPRIIYGVFGAVLVYAAVSMVVRRERVVAPPPPGSPDPLELGAAFHDPAARRDVGYIPLHTGWGIGVGAAAGIISGMLGVGGGVVMVPAMNVLMRVPLKAAVGTSSFMVGITSVATAFVFYSQGKIAPMIVVPSIIGVFIGGQIGSRLTRRVRAHRLALLFAIILLYLGASLMARAFQIQLPWQT